MTAFAVSDDGHLITCAHGLSEGSVITIVENNNQIPAQVLRLDRPNDVALLKADVRTPYIRLKPSAGVALGDRITVLGFPNPTIQGSSPKLTRGHVNSVMGMTDDVRHFQVDAPIQPGSSGSPVLADDGSVVGMIASRLNDMVVLGATGSMPQNVNYAVKSDYFIPLLSSVDGLLDRIDKGQRGATTNPERAIVLLLVVDQE